MTFAAVVLAGGSGSRMGTDTNKPYIEVAGRPLVWFSLEAFRRAGARLIVLVVRPADRHRLGDTEGILVVDGGPSRTASEQAGLAALESKKIDVVMIHDAARPFLTTGLIASLAEQAMTNGGAVPVLDFETPVWIRHGRALRPSENVLMRAQTPQAFRTEVIRTAYGQAAKVGANASDTAEIVERFSPTHIVGVRGSADLFKVTYGSDLDRVDAAAARWWQDEVT